MRNFIRSSGRRSPSTLHLPPPTQIVRGQAMGGGWRVEGGRWKVFLTAADARSLLCALLPILEELQVGGVPGVVSRLGIDRLHGVVHRHRGLRESGGNELELPLVRRDVSRGVNARQVGLHPCVDHDRMLLELKSPAADGAK